MRLKQKTPRHRNPCINQKKFEVLFQVPHRSEVGQITVIKNHIHYINTLLQKQNCLLANAAKPTSVIWRASRFSDLRELKPDSFFKPASVTKVKDKFMLSRFSKPRKYNKDTNKTMSILISPWRHSPKTLP